MDSREIDTHGPFKRSSRMPLDAVVRLHFEGTVAYQNGFAANVSATGMFVKHPDPPPVGTRLVFEFVIGLERRPVQGAGIVAWVRERYEGPGRTAGIGIQFTELDAASRQHIAEALFEYLEASIGAESAVERAEAEVAAAADVPPPAALQPLPPELEERLEDESAGDETVSAPPDLFAPLTPPTPLELAPAEPRTVSFAPAPPEDREAPEGRTVSFAAAEPAREETEDERIERLVRSALAEDSPYGAAAAAGAARANSPDTRRWIGIAAALAILAAGGWALWRYVLVPAPAPAPTSSRPATPPEPTPTPRPALSAQPDGTLAETVGATDAAETAPEAPLPATGGEPESAGRDETDEVPVAEPPPAEPAPTAAPERAAAAAAAATPEATESGPAARGVTDIEWTEATGITVVTITGDGAFAPGSYSYSEIGGENPRVLVRFKSLQRPYARASHEVGTAAVTSIRTGWHERPSGNEQHVVLDLAAPGVRLDGFEVLGSRIVLKLARR